MTTGFLARMERIALALTIGVTVVWSIASGVHAGASVVVGGLVGLGNFRLIRTLIGRILTSPPDVARGVSVALSAKLAALAGLLYVLLNVVGLQAVPFCVGLSTVFPAMLLALAGGVHDIEASLATPSATHGPS